MGSRLIKGFNEYVGPAALKRARIREIVLNEFELFGFEPTESPTVESEEFVKADAGEDTISEVYRLTDRGERKLALRYESTFQLKRLAKNQKLPFRRYTFAQVFRDEPTKANRFREFSQCDCDVVGASVKDEAEVLSLVKSVLDKLGIESKIYVNNRKLLNEILVDLGVEEKNREQAIREVDKLDKLSKKEVADNLKGLGAEKLLSVIARLDTKDQTGRADNPLNKYKFYGEIKELIKYCKMFGVKVEFMPTLARGLAYYNGTVFEVKTAKIKETICGGGAYLVDNVQAFGFAFGLDRLAGLSEVEGKGADVMVLSLDKDAEAVKIAQDLRERGLGVVLMMDKSAGKGLEYANGKGISKVVFVGKDEVGKDELRVKDMETGAEEWLVADEIASDLE